MAERKRATAIIAKDGNVLLFRRVKPEREYYAFPGGNAEEGESVEDALVREVREELSLNIESFRPLGTIENAVVPAYATTHTTSMDVVCFLVEKWSGTPELGGPEKERASKDNRYYIEWIPVAELNDMNNVFPLGVARKANEAIS